MSDLFTRFVREHGAGFVEGDDGALFKRSTKRRRTHMTKSELIREVQRFNSDELKSLRAAQRVVDTVLSTIEAATKRGERVVLHDFGSFEMKAARTTGQTPNGQKWKKPATQALRFTPHKATGRAAARDKLIKDVSAPSVSAPSETA